MNIGGARVGTIAEIDPVPSDTGEVTAELEIKLEKQVEPLSVDTTALVRPARSSASSTSS